MISEIPKVVKQDIVDLLQLKDFSELLSFSFVSGGCINHGGKLTTADRNYFIKWNERSKFPSMFKAEACGLALLSDSNAIHIPQVIGTGENETCQWLLLEWIESSHRSTDYWPTLGRKLAALHQSSNTVFGLDHNNYIGSLPQNNAPHNNWTDFFIQERIAPQLKRAVDGNLMPVASARMMERLYTHLNDLIPVEQPALLHGDLWSGNIIVNERNAPCLMDPAVYYGHREMDIAMTRLFETFDASFYEAYQEAFPLAPKFQERADIHNLYPLLVHVNLFGPSYRIQVDRILKRYS